MWKPNLELTKQHYIDWWNHKGIVLNMWEHFQTGVAPHDKVSIFGIEGSFYHFYKGKELPDGTAYDRGIRTLGLKKSRLHWSSEPVEQLKTLLRSYRDFPFFADCYQPTGGYRPDLDKLFPSEVLTKRRITSHPRDIPFQLGSPEGRDRLFRLYTYMVKSYTELGVSPLAYRMITENRYRDYSDGNRKRFEERLRKKFGNTRNQIPYRIADFRLPVLYLGLRQILFYDGRRHVQRFRKLHAGNILPAFLFEFVESL